MDEATLGLIARLEQAAGAWIGIVGVGIDLFGVLVIVGGITWATSPLIWRPIATEQYDRFKIRIARVLLLGLEILVAADIVKTIAVEPTLAALQVLAGLVLIRTFLSWSLVLEIEGRWPWQTSGQSARSASPPLVASYSRHDQPPAASRGSVDES